VIPALGRWRQEDGELQASLGYTGRPQLKNQTEGWGYSSLVEHVAGAETGGQSQAGIPPVFPSAHGD
jgi:hypothetical protein